MNKNIEVELRTFLDDDKFLELKGKLSIDFKFSGKLNETTIYFTGDKDLRIRENDKGAFLILKEGKIHDDARKEFEVKFDPQDFEKMNKLLMSLGYNTEIKWIRERLEYKKDDVKIFLDDTKGYGKILELEIITDKEGESVAKKKLMDFMNSNFGILEITSKEEFNERFEYYKKNWKSLIT